MAEQVNWDELRYRGDLADATELQETYRVGHYLETYQQSRRQQDRSIRERLMTKGIKLTEQLSPRIAGVFRTTCRNLGLTVGAEIFCLPDPEINAVAILDLHEGADRSIVGVTSAALERLEDDELAYILGHELGHFLFGNHRMNALINDNPQAPTVTLLPPLGESLFLRWRKKCEVSADRVGLVACRNLRSAGRALLKSTFGLSERNLNLDINALLAQIDEVKGKRELMAETFASHPLLPIRLKALQLFWQSEKAVRYGLPGELGARLSDEALENGVDGLMQLTNRYPDKPLDLAIMRAVALGGVQVLAADGDISEYETKVLIQVLHRWFTDEPEREIVTDLPTVRRQLAEAVEQVNKSGTHEQKVFIISRLAEVALADGALVDREGGVVLQTAESLGLPAKASYEILVSAATAVGFRVDVKLNRVAEELRRSLRIGCGLKETVASVKSDKTGK